MRPNTRPMPSEGPTSATAAKHPFRDLLTRLARPSSEPAKPQPPAADAPVDMVDQAKAFKELRVEDVMTPRADIVALDITTPLDQVVKVFVEAEHSRGLAIDDQFQLGRLQKR